MDTLPRSLGVASAPAMTKHVDEGCRICFGASAVLIAAVLASWTSARHAVAQPAGDSPAGKPAISEERLQLEREVRQLDAEGKLNEAIELSQRIVAHDEATLGRRHAVTGAGYAGLAFRLEKAGRFEEAIAARTARLEIVKQVYGDNDWRAVDAGLEIANLRQLSGLTSAQREELAAADQQDALGGKLYAEGKYADALKAARGCLEIRRRLLGDQHLGTANSLSNMRILLSGTGDYAAAQPYEEQALAILKKLLGEEHPKTAASLHSLAALLKIRGDYAAARTYCEQALAIQKKSLGEEHIETAKSLNTLAVIVDNMGDKAAARPYYEQALAIKLKLLGDQHRDTAASLNNLGLYLQSIGDYAEARATLEQALAINRKALGEEHPDTANSLNCLGVLEQVLGDDVAARQHLEQALAIRERVLGEGHPGVAESLDSLAYLLEFSGDPAAAKPLYKRALAIRRRVFGEEHPLTANSLNNLGSVHYSLSEFDEAKACYEQALAVRKKLFGEEHVAIGQSLNALGYLLHTTGDYAGARPYYEQSLAIASKILPPDHPDVAMARLSLAILHAAEEDWSTAISEVVASNEEQQRSLEKILATSTEARMRMYLRPLATNLSILLSMPLDESGRVADGLSWALRRKAIDFEALCQRRSMQLRAESDPQLSERLSTLAAAQRELDDLALRPNVALSPEQQAEQRQRVEEQIEQVSNQLLAEAAKQLGSNVSLMIDADAVRKALHAESALVEIVKYSPFDFHAIGHVQRLGEARYAAFVASADLSRPVELIELGEAAAIDEAVAAIGKQFEEAKRGDEFADWTALEAEYRKLAQPLYQRLFAPVAAKLGGVKRVYLSPDSQLHNLPFEALVDDQGKYLTEQGYSFAYLSSGRDLLREPSDAPGEGAYVFAAPNYNMQHGERFAQAQRNGAAASVATADSAAAGAHTALAAEASHSLATRSAEVRGLRWAVLPSMGPEGVEAAEHLDGGAFGRVAAYAGDAALEEEFKRLRSPKLVVIITHGFYLPDQVEAAEDDPLAEAGGTRGSFAQGMGMSRLRAQQNPLYRSGVVLAGANTLDEPLPAGMNVDDGWLTAEEISQLDLRGTDLVVLSACNTGRGQVATGNAVAGLRSAFMFSGARTLVGSLFEVPDQQTRELMKGFYAGLSAGRGKLDSLNDARLELIGKLRAETGAAHPFFWASFALVGAP